VAALFSGSNFSSSTPFEDYVIIKAIGGNTQVSGRFRGDNRLDFERSLVTLQGNVELSASDFIFQV
jgi:hypothetical protein